MGAGIGWAAATAFSLPEDVTTEVDYTIATAIDGEVGSTLSLNALASWLPVPAGTNQAVGVITTVEVSPGAEISQGETIYSVALRPVVVAQGEVPAFRAIQELTVGTDVTQLQSMLAELGFYSGEIDGAAGWKTTEAIKQWQKTIGVEPTGVVELGDVVFIAQVPARIVLDAEQIAIGLSLSGGERVVHALPSSPSFSMSVSPNQAAYAPAGTRVEIVSGTETAWNATVTTQKKVPGQDAVILMLGAESSEQVCANQCALIPVEGETLLASTLFTVEPVSGTMVPTVALQTRADGSIAVLDDNNMLHTVSVLASAKGMSIVEGIRTGSKVRIPAEKAR